MSWIRRAASTYRLLFQRRKLEAELDTEVTSYFDALAERYVEEGMSKEDAHRAARVKFEPPEQVKQMGKHLRLHNTNGKPIEIVGVAKTTKYIFISEGPLDYVYFPFAQNPHSQMTLISQARSPDVDALAPVLKQVIQGIDRNMPAFDMRSMSDLYLDRAMKTPRLITTSVAWLAAVGLLLAVVGLYGLLAYSVGRRTREIGIRMALGADRKQVVSMVMKQGLKLGIPGIAAGLVVGLTVFKALSSTLIFNFRSLGIVPFAAVSLLLLLTMMGASFVPARHASRVDPMRALREE